MDLDTSELGGHLTFELSDSHAYHWARGVVALRVEQDLGNVRYAGWAQFPKQAMTDIPMQVYAMQRVVDTLRPWRRPDPCPFPPLDLFPKATAARRQVQRALTYLRGATTR